MFFTKALEAGYDAKISYLSRGAAYLKLKEPDRAIGDFSKAIELDNSNVRSYYYRGMANAQKKDFEKAVADFSKAIELKPDDGASIFARGASYIELGKLEEAGKDIKNAAIIWQPGYRDTRALSGQDIMDKFLRSSRERRQTLEINEDELETIRQWLKGGVSERSDDTPFRKGGWSDIRDIREAADSTGGFIHKTPLIYSNSFSSMTGAEVYLKAENLQKTGSFKVRGAFHKLNSLKSKKVIAASMGNHAQGVAFAAARLGIHARIVMPLSASIVKQEAAKGYGAELLLHGESFQEALQYARSQKDYDFIHAFDDEKIIAGQGTIGLEIIEDLKDIDAIIVPVGGGGLISGIAVAVKTLSPGTEIIGVQTSSAASAYTSFREKKIAESVPTYTLADGIAVGKIGDITFDIINKYVDDMMIVDEDSIAMAILLFLERKKLVVEGAGTVPSLH
jgi:threonine dehydratase